MFSFFTKKQSKRLHDLAILGADMHSHLIPGIDDGAKTVDDSLSLVKQLVDLGYKKIITSPHVYQEYYPNTFDTIENGLRLVRKALSEHDMHLDFSAGAEYYLDEHFEELLNEKQSIRKISGNYVLVEMGFFGAPPNLENYIFQLQLAGYKPILAHPERYSFYQGKLDAFIRLKDLGCVLQVNLLSLAGYYGKEVAHLAQKLIKNELVSFLGTDLHHQRHMDTIREALNNKAFVKYILDYEYQNKTLLG